MPQRHSTNESLQPRDRFATTQWSLVKLAGDIENQQAKDALQILAQNYWFPLYAYARRRLGGEKAKDMTQEFFVALLDKNVLQSADREKGRFRAFLLTAFKRFMSNQHDRENSVKRGGGRLLLSLDFESADSRYAIQPLDDETAEKIYERQWVLTLLENVMARLRKYYVSRGDEFENRFDTLQSMIIGESSEDYVALSKQLDRSPEALRAQVHRMRKKYRETLRAEIAETVADPAEIDDEIQRLFDVMG